MYYTKERVDVTERISKGKTKLFEGLGLEKQQEAEKYAFEKKSYFYEVYTNNSNNKRVLCGFAVPN